MEQEIINIAFCCDDKYADKMTVAMLSAAENTKRTLAFYVIDCGISEKSKEIAFSLQKRYSNIEKIEFKEVEKNDVLENLENVSNWPILVFYRLTIPMLWPNLQKVAYLDCDMLVDGDLDELWEVDLHGKPLGVVHEAGLFQEDEFGVESLKKQGLSLPPNRKYFNAGFFIVDTNLFFKHDIFQRIVDFIANHKKTLVFPEQDAMNVVLTSDEIQELSGTFNFTPFSSLAPKVLKSLNGNPIIIHYTVYKPWTFNKKLISFLLLFPGIGGFETFIQLYWSYSEKLDKKKFCAKSMQYTLHYIKKQYVNAIEKNIRKVLYPKKFRNFIRKMFSKVFKK